MGRRERAPARQTETKLAWTELRIASFHNCEKTKHLEAIKFRVFCYSVLRCLTQKHMILLCFLFFQTPSYPFAMRVTKIATVIDLVSVFQQDNQAIVIWDSQLRKGLSIRWPVGKFVGHFLDLVIDVGECCLLSRVILLGRLSKPWQASQ